MPCEAQAVFNEYDPKRLGRVSSEKLPEMVAQFSMKKGKRKGFDAAYATVYARRKFGSTITNREFVFFMRLLSAEHRQVSK
jgi:hypothetical protein